MFILSNNLIHVFYLLPGETFSDVLGDLKVKKIPPFTTHYWGASGDTILGGK